MSDIQRSMPIKTEGDLDQYTRIKIYDGTATNVAEVDSDNNLHVQIHGDDPAGSDRVIRTSEEGHISTNGVYDGTSNTDPANMGLIAHTRTATPGDTHQTYRSTGATPADNVPTADIHALDVNAFFMGYDPVADQWDRVQIQDGLIRTTTASEKDEDDAHASGDTGSFTLGVRSRSSAQGDLTVVDFSQLSGDTFTIDGTILTEGVEWTAATDNDTTAASLAAAIDALAGYSASADGAVISIIADPGSDGNVSTSTSDGTNLTVPAALAGGADHTTFTSDPGDYSPYAVDHYGRMYVTDDQVLAQLREGVTVSDGGGSITVDATDLDIRDLTAASDSVASWLNDGTGNAITSTAGALDVNIFSGNLTVDLDGIYNAGSNADPDNVGVVWHTRSAAPGDPEQLFRPTGVQGSDDNTVYAIDVALHDEAGNAFGSLNPLPVSITDAVDGDDIHDFEDNGLVDVAAAASDNHDYTVSAGKTLILKKVQGAASSRGRWELQVETGVGTGTFDTKGVWFTTEAHPSFSETLDEPIEVAAGVIVRFVRTNRDSQPQCMYSFFNGIEK